MEGVSLNTGPAGVLANEGGNAVTRSRDDRDTQPGGQPQNEPRVNEGPSTRSNISTQGLELARQDPVPGSGESPQVSQDNRQVGAQQQAGNEASDSAGQDGRLIDDDSPNELLRG
ncbi:MAG: hypothetical protein H2060_06035 [Azoarcus sp.]|nr:hypothetical protein [Azoarcus sp.]